MLVIHDLLGLFDRFTPKFVKRYAALKDQALAAVKEYKKEVETGAFPSATAQVVTVSAPTATLVPGAVTLTATANVVTVSAGTAVLQGGLDAADDLHTWTVDSGSQLDD